MTPVEAAAERRAFAESRLLHLGFAVQDFVALLDGYEDAVRRYEKLSAEWEADGRPLVRVGHAGNTVGDPRSVMLGRLVREKAWFAHSLYLDRGPAARVCL